jgi:hypothetical protein
MKLISSSYEMFEMLLILNVFYLNKKWLHVYYMMDFCVTEKSNNNRRRFFIKLTNQKQELPMMAMFVNGSSNIYRGPSIDASYQVSNHLAKRFQRRIIFFKSEVLYRDCSFRFDPLSNMAATGNSCFRLVAF